MSAAIDNTANTTKHTTTQPHEKNNIMNGIKKVFHRNSTSSIDEEDRLSSTMGSPTSATRKLSTSSSSDANTSVDSHEPSSPRKGAIAQMTTNVKPNTSKTAVGTGRSEQVATMQGGNRHTEGHSLPKNDKVDLTQGKVTQTVEHLAGITDRTHHTHQIEEVTRNRTLERHQHHIQVHHQPIINETHAAEKVQTKAHPITNISETHASTDKDAALLASVAHSHGHKSQDRKAAIDHQIVDKGEYVNEQIHHHIHNVVIPLITENSHEHFRIQTTIPTHHVVHEAPIIHQATTLEPISPKDFLARGGVMNATKKHVDEAKLLHNGECARKVDGVAEKLAKEMNLSSNGSVSKAAPTSSLNKATPTAPATGKALAV